MTFTTIQLYGLKEHFYNGGEWRGASGGKDKAIFNF